MVVRTLRSGPLGRWAFSAPRHYAVAGPRGGAALRALDEANLEVAPGPRTADVLVVGGSITPEFVAPLRRTYAAVATPRTAVWLRPEGTPEAPDPPIPFAAVVPPPWGEGAVASALDAAREALISSPDAAAPLPGDPEADGGYDMPGGRGMAGLGPDPDDLWLDELPVHVGPLDPVLPHGLHLRVVLQGDRVRDAELLAAGWARPVASPAGEPAGRPPPPPAPALDPAALGPDADPFGRALLVSGRLGPAAGPFDRGPVRPDATPTIAALEASRAVSHLRWAATLAGVLGLEGDAARLGDAVRLAGSGALPDAATAAGSVLRRLGWGPWTRRRLRGVGVLPGEALREAGVTGPVLRAAGVPEDVRSTDPAYRELGFEPVVEEGSDALARLRVRAREVLASPELAEGAGDARPSPAGAVEGPRGALAVRAGAWRTPSRRLAGLTPGLARGAEWSEMIDAVLSLDLDPEEATA